MPTYEYRTAEEAEGCDVCRSGLEVRHGMSEPGPSHCPACGSKVTRVIFAPQIRGDRWSEKRLLNKDNLRKHGFKTGSDLLESGEVSI